MGKNKNLDEETQERQEDYFNATLLGPE